MSNPGDRVGAIQKADSKTVHFYGYGVYDGEFPHSIFGDDFMMDNPRITLNRGGIVWGCECWWGPEEKIKKTIGDREVIFVDVEISTPNDQITGPPSESRRTPMSNDPAPVHRLVGRMFRCRDCCLTSTSDLPCRKCGGDVTDCTDAAIRMEQIRRICPTKWTPISLGTKLIAWGSPIYPPNVRDDLAGANQPSQSKNNADAGSSPSTCWADAQSAGETP